jgi:hypothetical protein
MHGFSYGKVGVSKAVSPEQHHYNQEAQHLFDRYTRRIQRGYSPDVAKEIYLDAIYALRDSTGIRESTSLIS